MNYTENEIYNTLISPDMGRTGCVYVTVCMQVVSRKNTCGLLNMCNEQTGVGAR